MHTDMIKLLQEQTDRQTPEQVDTAGRIGWTGMTQHTRDHVAVICNSTVRQKHRIRRADRQNHRQHQVSTGPQSFHRQRERRERQTDASVEFTPQRLQNDHTAKSAPLSNS